MTSAFPKTLPGPNSDSGCELRQAPARPWCRGKAAVELIVSQIRNHRVGIPEVCREVLTKGRLGGWRFTADPERTHSSGEVVA